MATPRKLSKIKLESYKSKDIYVPYEHIDRSNQWYSG